jgi:hypothetical protein
MTEPIPDPIPTETQNQVPKLVSKIEKNLNKVIFT